MASPLPSDKIAAALQGLPGWVFERDALAKTFKFADFREALAFMVRAGFEAEAMNHHPDWSNVYNRVEIRLNTHDAGGKVTEKDVELAGRLQKLAKSVKVAFISGTSIVNSTLFASWEAKTIKTEYGEVAYKSRGEHALINRHGYAFPLPPHSINYRANIRALADLGFQDIVSLNSVGSLKRSLPPGTLVSCSDYVGLQQGPATFFDRELKGGPAGIANNLIPLLVKKLRPEFSIRTGKVYVQMRGPRFETKAEIRVVKAWGDVIGMTAAHEADLCSEIGLRYNSLAIIDNYANGLEGTEIDFGKFKGLVQANQRKVNRLFERMLELLR